jgi:hypothetical protein
MSRHDQFVYHPKNNMYEDDSGLEQRLSRFEAQLDRFNLAIHQWRQTQGQTGSGASTDLNQQIRSLEETITREAQALRQIHEEPIKQLQAHAESLASLAQSLQTLVADLRLTAGGAAPGAGSGTWPLERVVHLHDELRRAAGGGDSSEPPSRPIRLLQAGNARDILPLGILSKPRWWYARAAMGASVIGLTVAFVWWIESRLDDAAARVAAAEQQVVTTTELANREVAAARQDADRQIAEARQLAQRAETVGSILTAPDLIRFNLTSSETVGPSAQLLWSRTRGVVLSGSRLPAAPPQSTYQLWLVTNTQSVGVGLFVPDDAGRATLVVDAPPRVPGPVVGAAVTIEPSGGRSAPSGRTLLARFP